MTQPEPFTDADAPVYPDDLDDWLDGPEPPWDDEPQPPPDAPRANALVRRLTRLMVDRQADVEQVRVHTEQVQAWALARDEARTRQEGWLRGALRRYHEAVLVTNPKALSINLPAGDLVSRLGQPEWVADTDFAEWVLPASVLDALDTARAEYEAEVTRIIAGAPLPGAIKPPKVGTAEVSISGMKDVLTRRDDKGKPIALGVTDQGEAPPGLTVKPAERNFDIKPRTADTSSTEDEAR